MSPLIYFDSVLLCVSSPFLLVNKKCNCVVSSCTFLQYLLINAAANSLNFLAGVGCKLIFFLSNFEL